MEAVMDEKLTDPNMIDLYEQMLFERAAQGIRPVLYISSSKDLECSMVMLLDERSGRQLAGRQQAGAKGSAITL
jgi:hypothetical protein